MKPELAKAKPSIVVEIIEYVPHAVVIRTIIDKLTGNISAIAFDSGETLTDRLSRFDNFIQIIEGNAEVKIDGIAFQLQTGESIIIPAHTQNTIYANIRFKMLSTIIKSGYEQIA